MARLSPTMRTWIAGETFTAAQLNANLRDAGDFLSTVPHGVLYQTTVQSIPNATWTALSCDQTYLDLDGGHSNVTNNSRYTVQVAGVYWAFGYALFASNATGVRGARITKNGTASNASQGMSAPTPANVTAATTTEVITCAVGDYLEIQGFQSSGGALNTSINADLLSILNVVWIHN